MDEPNMGNASQRALRGTRNGLIPLALALFGLLAAAPASAAQDTVDLDADRDTLLRLAESQDPRHYIYRYGIYRTLLERNAEDPQALSGMANQFMVDGQWDSCIEHAERGARIESPVQQRTVMTLGICMDGAGQKEEALKVLERAIDMAPQDARPHFHRATTLSRMGRNADAKTALERAIRLDREFAPAYLNYAKLLDVENRDGAAVATYLTFLWLGAEPGGPAEAVARIRLLVARQTTIGPDGKLTLNLRLPPGSSTQENALSVALATTVAKARSDAKEGDALLQETLDIFVQILAELAHRETGFFREHVLVPLERLDANDRRDEFLRRVVTDGRRTR